jgi:hypothetical protein
MEESEGTVPGIPNSGNRQTGVVGFISNREAPSVPKQLGLGAPGSGSALCAFVWAANENKIAWSCSSCPGLYGHNQVIPAFSEACWPP